MIFKVPLQPRPFNESVILGTQNLKADLTGKKMAFLKGHFSKCYALVRGSESVQQALEVLTEQCELWRQLTFFLNSVWYSSSTWKSCQLQ